MNLFGNKQRLCTNGWLVAALLLLGLNGYAYFSLESQALEGNSRTITALRQKLDQLKNIAANSTLLAPDRIFNGSFFSRFNAKEPGQPRIAHEPENTAQADKSNPAQLPLLTGILESLDPIDGIRYLAVLNGKVCRENDRVESFTVTKISKSGVVLKGFGARWEIQSPTPYYSNDQGR
jgi:hypothetical protein